MTVGFTSKIVPELASLAQPIGNAKRHPDNIRIHDIPAIARSLQEHGQRSPIVVQASTGLIVKGNGTHEAAELLGWDEIAQSWQELDDDAALTYLMADNRASDRSRNDRDKTTRNLRKLIAGPGIFATLWTEEELEELEGPTPRAVGEFKGDYVDDASERQAEMQSKMRAPGAKMKEVPIVLTIADHAAFIGNCQKLQKLYGTTGTIQTVVEAVRRQAEGIPTTQGDIGDATELRTRFLREARDYFLTDGRPTWSMGAIAAFFQSAMNAPEPTPEPETAAAPGQISLDDLL